ncbi:MAG: GNAT family N-acetyltransferase [Acidimicrobiia bacterium]
MLDLRPPTAADLVALVDLNNAAAPAVNRLPAPDLVRLVDAAAWARVVVAGDAVVGGLVALDGPGLDYESENYAWFSDRYDSFLYVDRVVVSTALRGAGIGSGLYRAMLGHAEDVGHRVVCAEVNVRPANPGSLRFHRRHGFQPVGEQDTKGGTVRVRMLAREV